VTMPGQVWYARTINIHLRRLPLATTDPISRSDRGPKTFMWAICCSGDFFSRFFSQSRSGSARTVRYPEMAHAGGRGRRDRFTPEIVHTYLAGAREFVRNVPRLLILSFRIASSIGSTSSAVSTGFAQSGTASFTAIADGAQHCTLRGRRPSPGARAVLRARLPLVDAALYHVPWTMGYRLTAVAGNLIFLFGAWSAVRGRELSPMPSERQRPLFLFS